MFFSHSEEGAIFNTEQVFSISVAHVSNKFLLILPNTKARLEAEYIVVNRQSQATEIYRATAGVDYIKMLKIELQQEAMALEINKKMTII